MISSSCPQEPHVEVGQVIGVILQPGGPDAAQSPGEGVFSRALVQAQREHQSIIK